MKLPRRNFLHLAAGAAALSAVSHVARAQAYPARPVRWVVGYTPGKFCFYGLCVLPAIGESVSSGYIWDS